MCSKLTIKIWRRSDVFIVSFENISHLVLVFFIVNFEQVNVGWAVITIENVHLKIKTDLRHSKPSVRCRIF